MSEDIIDGIFSIVSSVLHLGNVHFVPDGDKANYRDARAGMYFLLFTLSFHLLYNVLTMLVLPEESVAIVADLMGLDPERLKWGLKNKKIKTMREVIDKPLNAEQAKDQTDAFAKHAYATLFDWTVQQLNANMISETFKSFIGVLDIFGFEVFEVCHRHRHRHRHCRHRHHRHHYDECNCGIDTSHFFDIPIGQ